MHHSLVFLSLMLLVALSSGFLFGVPFVFVSWLFRHSAPQQWRRLRLRTKSRNILLVIGLVSCLAFVVFDPEKKLVAVLNLAAYSVVFLVFAFAMAWLGQKREVEQRARDGTRQ